MLTTFQTIKLKLLCRLFLVFAIMFLASCKKSADSETEIKSYSEEQLLGKWVYDQIKLNGKLYTWEHQQGCEKDRFYFNKYPNYRSYQEIISMNTNCITSQTYTHWQLQKDILTLAFGDIPIKYKILRLDSLHFDVSIRMDFDNDGKKDNLEIYALKEDCGNDIFCQ